MRIGLFLLHLLALGCISAAGCAQQSDAVARSAAPSDSSDGTLDTAGIMGSARAAHTSTALPDGRVLLAGGMARGEGTAAGAEIFVAASGTFLPTGPMRTPRHSHTATILSDGKVLLTGGYSAQGEYLRSAELYDASTGTFELIGTMGSARADHLAVPLHDGRVLIIGGVSTGWTFLSSAEIYDPATTTFAPTGAMTSARESHAAVRLDDGRVLVVGGHEGRRSAIRLHSSAEIYDPSTGTFSEAGEMTIRRHKHDALLLPDGRALITGGADEHDSRGVYSSVELYDPRTRKFQAASSMRMPRYKHRGTSVVLSDGRVLLAGGATRAEVYDPQTDSSSLVEGEARLAGQFSATALLPDGRVFINGGYGADLGPQSSTWIFRPR